MKRKNTTPTRHSAIRAAAAFLSILMLLSVITVLPVAAEGTVSDYTVDFTQLDSTDKNYAHKDTVGDQVTVFLKEKGSFATLTETGLQTGSKSGSTTRDYAGIQIATPSDRNFVIEMDLSFENLNQDTTNSTMFENFVLEFGFNYSLDKNTWDPWNYANCTWKADKNFKTNHTTTQTATNTSTMWNHIVNGDTLTFRFYVYDGMLNGWTFISGTDSITFMYNSVNQECMKASTNKFALCADVKANYVGEDENDPYINFTKVAVTATDSTAIVNNRTEPVDATTNYTDSANVNYAVGTMLHNMDFSKVNSFADTGYFFTMDNKYQFNAAINNGVLNIVTTKYWTNLAVTANDIPENIQNYTTSVRFRFVGGINARIVLVHGHELVQEGTNTGKLGTIPNGANNNIYQSGSVSNFTTDKLTTKDTLSAGNWVTVTSSYKDGNLEKVVFTYDNGQTEEMTPSATVAGGKDFVFRLATYTNIEISNIQYVAGTYDEQKASTNGLLFPEADNALVQTVKSPVVAKYVQQKTNDEGKVDVRFVSGVYFENLDAFAKIGYEITSLKVNDQEKLTNAVELAGTSIFTSINAGGETYVAGEGEFADCDYIFALELLNFDTEGTFEVTLTSYAEKENGARMYDYNGSVTVIVSSGTVTVK